MKFIFTTRDLIKKAIKANEPMQSKQGIEGQEWKKQFPKENLERPPFRRSNLVILCAFLFLQILLQ